MAEFKKKTSSKFWHSPLMLGVLFLALVVFIYNMLGLIATERETAKKKQLILEQIDTLHQREEVLSADISRLNTEEGIEDLIREKYQVVKPGEKMVVIVDKQEEKENANGSLKDHSFWGFIKRTFGIK
jgi:cell division protein FtsB